MEEAVFLFWTNPTLASKTETCNANGQYPGPFCDVDWNILWNYYVQGMAFFYNFTFTELSIGDSHIAWEEGRKRGTGLLQAFSEYYTHAIERLLG